MAVNTLTLYMPGSSVGIQVYEGSQLHLILVSQGANSIPSAPGETVRQDPFPQYVDDDELAAALAGVGGGGGAVDSVNGQTGPVVLDADNIADSATRKLMTSDERDKLADITPGANLYTDEQVRDVIGVTLVAGANVIITPDEDGNTVTIDAASQPYAVRTWDPTAGTWSARPSVPAGVPVVSYSALYVDATPPPGSSPGDVWMLHKDSPHWPVA